VHYTITTFLVLSKKSYFCFGVHCFNSEIRSLVKITLRTCRGTAYSPHPFAVQHLCRNNTKHLHFSPTRQQTTRPSRAASHPHTHHILTPQTHNRATSSPPSANANPIVSRRKSSRCSR